jgi:hypothetical protein
MLLLLPLIKCETNRFITNNTIKLTAVSQQYSLLRQQDRTCTPREAFISDLTAFIKSIHHRDNGVLLLGDFNEPFSFEYKGMTGLVIECNLSDVMFRLQDQDSFPTYLRGHTRVDYALASEWVADSVLTGCYEPFCYRTKGDHRNMVLDIDVVSLLGTPTYQLGMPNTRQLHNTDCSSVRKYLLGKYKYLVDHKFQARLDKLEQHWDPIAAEKLDKDWSTASHHAESLCVKKPNYAYVHQLSALRTKRNILSHVITQHWNGISMEASIEKLASTGTDFCIPESIS